jgi:cellulose synthase/poly-beta-1,6-N-acetylglucosamine synthase-like glycosyltransferase
VVIDDDALGYSEGLYWRYESMIKRWETRFGSTVGVNGEIIAIRRELFATAPAGIINDDTWLARLVLRGAHRIAYAEQAVSSERVSADAAAEQARRSRMVAGQLQVLQRARTELPWRRPVVTWQLISHKLLRPLVPLWMGAALVLSLISLFIPGNGTGFGAVPTLAEPWNYAAVAAQALFYLLAFAGGRATGLLGKVAYLPRFLWDSNVAAVQGMARLLSGRQTVLWERVARREEPMGGSE